MVIEYTYSAKCKDCKFCGYYHLIKKDGTTSYQRRHKCILKNKSVRINDLVCNDWQISYSGIPDPIWKIEESLKQLDN